MLGSSPSLGLPCATVCVQNCDDTQSRLGDVLGVLGKTGSAKGGVPLHHLAWVPSAQALQPVEVGPALPMPAGPGRTQRVPAEVPNSGARECLAPRVVIHPCGRTSLVREYVVMASESSGTAMGRCIRGNDCVNVSLN